MIYVFTALYSEAAPLIECFSLIEDKNFKYKTYVKRAADAGDAAVGGAARETAGDAASPEILVCVTGMGPVKAAAAVASVLTMREASETDMLVNIGICAGDTVDEAGQVVNSLFLVNKLTNAFASRDFYPDMMVASGLPERALTTVAVPVGPGEVAAGMLYDMEGAAVYEAASQFLAPHQMSFLKIVSDMGETSGLTPQKVSDIVREKLPEIKEYICRLEQFGKQLAFSNVAKDEKIIAEKLSAALKCSKTMEEELKVLLHFYRTSGNDPAEIYDRLLAEETIPVPSKRDGKKILEWIKGEIIG